MTIEVRKEEIGYLTSTLKPRVMYSLYINGKHVWRLETEVLGYMLKDGITKALEVERKESDPTSRVEKVEKAQKIY